MIDVAVRVDHRDDGTVTAAMGAVQRQRRGGHLRRYQGIDDDDPGVALDEGDVGDVEPADLVDAGHHLVQTLFGGQGGLAPQAGVDRCRRGSAEEPIGVVVPHHAAVGRLDDARGQGRDESTIGVVEVRRVVERQGMFAMGRLDDGGGGFVVHGNTLPLTRPCLEGRVESRRVNRNETISPNPFYAARQTRILP
jgi:hypothetical protein